MHYDHKMAVIIKDLQVLDKYRDFLALNVCHIEHSRYV